jgi:hypothetical protein
MKSIWKKHQWKIITALLVACVLVLAFWYGGNAPGLSGWDVSVPSPSAFDTAVLANTADIAPVQKSDTSTPDIPSGATAAPFSSSPVEQTPSASPATAQPSPSPSPETSAAPGADSDRPLSASEKLALAKQIAGGASSAGVQKGDTGYSESQGMQINPETGKDQYLTDPVPEGKPIPVEPENAVVTDEVHTCTLSVRCDTILDNISWLDPDKVELVPEDGVIFPSTTVTFYQGESVFNVLQREMKKAGIHMEFQNTPMYNSAYIEAINNLYEFDCGELSGWLYKVNSWFPNYGCSRYQLHEGDVIEWVYTCNLGIDVGGYYAVGG